MLLAFSIGPLQGSLHDRAFHPCSIPFKEHFVCSYLGATTRENIFLCLYASSFESLWGKKSVASLVIMQASNYICNSLTHHAL
jgi:hypothetical protein